MSLASPYNIRGPERTGTIISPGHTVTCPYDVCRAGCADLESSRQMIPPAYNDRSEPKLSRAACGRMTYA
jgi:hypothetical protein